MRSKEDQAQLSENHSSASRSRPFQVLRPQKSRFTRLTQSVWFCHRPVHRLVLLPNYVSHSIEWSCFDSGFIGEPRLGGLDRQVVGERHIYCLLGGVRKPFSSADAHYPGSYSSVLYLKNSDRDGQPESAWSRAARVEVENSFAPADAWSMRVSANDGCNSSGYRVTVEFVDVVEHVKPVSRQFDAFGGW